MSVHKTITLTCDNCPAKIGHHESVAGIRALAKRTGWIRRNGLDYCKNCARNLIFSKNRVWRIIRE